MPTVEKEKTVAEVTEKLVEAKSVFLTDFTGLNVKELSELRRIFSNAQVHYKVVKNTLARISAKNAGCDDIIEYIEGPIAMAFGMEDPIAPAKIIKEFSKKNDKLKLKACLFEGVLFGEDRLGEIASLPTREQIMAKLCGVLNAPLANLVYSLNGIISKLVYALNAVKERKEKES
ncbi:MAG TPA: 50S ribosomal protein L10 [Chitinophagaceae bacterium]|nr:50S ribosomal protein L10 [Chitinophagaceae bacterium]